MKLILLLFSLAIAAGAQDMSSPPVRDLSTSCSDPSYQQACRSYNELISARDTEVMALLQSRDTYVCFREGEDVFYMISLGTPPGGDFKKIGQSPFYRPPYHGLVFYKRFKGGQDDDSKIVSGEWTKLGPDASPNFETPAKQIPSLHVTESEISFYEEYKNVGGGETTYSLQIRRSTMRASETFQWHISPADPKKQPNNGSDTDSGHCILFD